MGRRRLRWRRLRVFRTRGVSSVVRGAGLRGAPMALSARCGWGCATWSDGTEGRKFGVVRGVNGLPREGFAGQSGAFERPADVETDPNGWFGTEASIQVTWNTIIVLETTRIDPVLSARSTRLRSTRARAPADDKPRPEPPLTAHSLGAPEPRRAPRDHGARGLPRVRHASPAASRTTEDNTRPPSGRQPNKEKSNARPTSGRFLTIPNRASKSPTAPAHPGQGVGQPRRSAQRRPTAPRSASCPSVCASCAI